MSAVIILIVTFILWGLFHKFVFSVYFGGFRNMIGTIFCELIACFWVATFLVNLAGAGVGALFSLVFKILFMVVKFAVIAAVIGGAAYGGYKLYQRISRRTEQQDTKEQEHENGREDE